MDNLINISIIIPVYNQEKYLTKCIQSLEYQTLENIQIIFVNDASTDNSQDILEEYAKKNKKVSVIEMKKNVGTSVARKKGVEAALGQYIMFLDSDDELVEDACEIIWNTLQDEAVDILQFGTKIICESEYEKEEREVLKKLLTPYDGTVRGEMVENCFDKHRWGFTLWNKVYNAKVCKKAFDEITDDYIVISEDLYAFFLISYYSKTYKGINDKLYVYHFGCGITTNNRMGLEQFERYCTRFKVITALEKFVKKKSTDEEDILRVEKMKNEFLNDALYKWKETLAISDGREAYDKLLQILGPSSVISAMARNYWYNSKDILARIARRDRKHEKGKKVQRIGVYYHRIRNGGVEKVISLLIPMWIEMGYEIVLITDEKPNRKDYLIPTSVERRIINNFIDSEKEKYKKRAEDWEKIVTECNLDTIVYNSCNCFTIMWDVCMLKGLNCNVIVETHSMFSGTMWYSPIFASFLPQIYRLVDRVVALSTIDVTFWRNYCPAYYIPNPISVVEKEKVVNVQENKNILWVGRLSPEKKPEAAIEAFSLVHKVVKDATLTIVGAGDSDREIEQLKKRADALEIEDYIEFTGFQREVSKYYQNSSVMLITSLCESFSMVLAESKGYGLPTVMYELPNLEMVRNKRGIIEVPQDDIWALADGIIELLTDDDLRLKMGKEARESIEEFASVNVASLWKKLFDSCEEDIGFDVRRDSDISLMLDLLFEDVSKGLEFMQKIGGGVNNSSIDVQYVYDRIKNHEEVLNRHEEVVNRHEEVVNRHEQVVNNDWAWLKEHERRITELENRCGIFKRIYRYCKRIIKSIVK